MPGQQETLWMKMRAKSLGNAENYSTAQCTPQASSAADDCRFKRENKLQRA